MKKFFVRQHPLCNKILCVVGSEFCSVQLQMEKGINKLKLPFENDPWGC
jgi:hypothetical protein